MTDPTPQQQIDTARRHFALKEYDLAVDSLATALEALRDNHAEDDAVLAPILHLYGRALLEHAILNSGALGAGGSKDAPLPSKSKKQAVPADDPRFSFSGDAESEDEADEPQPQGEGEEEEEEDDDDLGVAFSVLDLSRVIFERTLSTEKKLNTLDGAEWDETRLQAELAEVLNDLGDVGLESENFQQASADYKKALDLLMPLLYAHSRRLADAHLRLGLALEFHPDVKEREGAVAHVKEACETIKKRLYALQARKETIAAGQAPEQEQETKLDTSGKGKGKGKAQKAEKDDVLEMSQEKVDLEIKDLSEMKDELEVKLQEYESPQGAAQLSGANGEPGQLDAPATKAALEQAIAEAFLGASTNAPPTLLGGAPTSSGPVNDLSSMVKRKKKPAEGEKRKAEEVAPEESKKARVEDEA